MKLITSIFYLVFFIAWISFIESQEVNKFQVLPLDIQKEIFKHLFISHEATRNFDEISLFPRTKPEPLCVLKAIHQLLLTDTTFYKVINSEVITQFFINEISRRYTKSKILAATYLATRGAGSWLIEYNSSPHKNKIIHVFVEVAKKDEVKKVNFILDHLPFALNKVIGYRNALYGAATNNCSTMVEELLKKSDIDPNIQVKNGFTPLMGAIYAKKSKIISQLLAAQKLDVNIQNNCKETALIMAVKEGDENTVTQLITMKDIKLNLQDIFGYTALYTALLYGHKSIFSALFHTPGIDINIPNDNGKTPLMSIAMSGDILWTKKLLAAGALVDAKDHEGRSAIDWVNSNNNISSYQKHKIRKLLEEAQKSQ